MAVLVDTNVLVYAYDRRHPLKQQRAAEVLAAGIRAGTVRVPHQALVEFVAAVSRPVRGGAPILPLDEARREADDMLAVFDVVYPSEAVLRTALRGSALYELSWYDAHMWAYAEVNGIDELWSEHFQHDRMYGTVRIVNPFL